jgi:RNA polymerase sigma-70 factor (ECF subfamily)
MVAIGLARKNEGDQQHTITWGATATEEALVAAAKEGDESAFETLVKRYRPRIFALALRYTRVPEDAEDVVQEAFKKALVSLCRFEGKSAFSTWLTRIAINEALMLLRRGRALREVPIEESSNEEDTTVGLDIADPTPNPEARYLQREGTQILARALSELTPGVRTAIQLRELRELTSQETARRMGLTVSAIKARIFHGKRKLRVELTRCMDSRSRENRRCLCNS